MEIKFPAILDKNIGITVIGPVIVFINWKEANKDEISNFENHPIIYKFDNNFIDEFNNIKLRQRYSKQSIELKNENINNIINNNLNNNDNNENNENDNNNNENDNNN